MLYLDFCFNLMAGWSAGVGLVEAGPPFHPASLTKLFGIGPQPSTLEFLAVSAIMLLPDEAIWPLTLSDSSSQKPSPPQFCASTEENSQEP